MHTHMHIHAVHLFVKPHSGDVQPHSRDEQCGVYTHCSSLQGAQKLSKVKVIWTDELSLFSIWTCFCL